MFLFVGRIAPFVIFRWDWLTNLNEVRLSVLQRKSEMIIFFPDYDVDVGDALRLFSTHLFMRVEYDNFHIFCKVDLTIFC